MEKRYREAISKEFEDCVSNTIKRIQSEDTYRPFHSALLSDDALFWSRFERSFSTSFGQRVIEELAKLAVLSNGADKAEKQRQTVISISNSGMLAIDQHLNAIRSNSLGRPPKWDADLESITSQSTGTNEESRVISDLWWTKNGVNNYISIKTVKPNIDQTAEAKRDLLKLKLNDPSCNVFFGLYYNPYGENQSDYSWSPPKRVFDIISDPVVLIGKPFWDTLGGEGFYEEVIQLAQEVGVKTKKLIEKKFSGK